MICNKNTEKLLMSAEAFASFRCHLSYICQVFSVLHDGEGGDNY